LTYLVSPTERTPGRGLPSSIPERFGADFLIITDTARIGVQRKQFPGDFFASHRDGRLVRELMQLQALDYALLVMEGRPQWTSDGHLLDLDYSRWSRSQVRNLLRTVRLTHGVDVEWSEDVQDTLAIVEELEGYWRKSVHRSLFTRSKDGALKDDWGKFSRRDFARYFLQGIPGIGPVTAEGIFDYFGRVPLEWICSRQEMGKVYGVGPKTVEQLFRVMEG